MKKDILDKLKNHCSYKINSVCQVVYLLVEIRKFLDYDKKGILYKKQCSFLKICCTWAVHIKIEDTKLFREMFEQIYREIQKYSHDENKEALEKQISNIISFKKFRDQLFHFLKNFEIKDITTDEQEWREFIKSCLSVIADCPLIKINEHIEQFSINKKGGWEIKLKDHQPISGCLIL